MKLNMLWKYPSFLTQIAALSLALICFTNQTHAAEVGGVYRPTLFTGDTAISHGHLVVYTPTQETTWGMLKPKSTTNAFKHIRGSII